MELRIGKRNFFKLKKHYFGFRLGIFMLSLKWHWMIDNVVGVCSICVDGQHVFFLDADNLNYNYFKERLKFIQKKYRMGDIIVFITKVNRLGYPCSFHAWCLDKHTFGEIMDRFISFDYRETKKIQLFGTVRGRWVLRTSGKYNRPVPQFFEIIKGYKNNRKESSAHAEFLKRYYGINVKLKNPDKLDVIIQDVYPTVVKDPDTDEG